MSKLLWWKITIATFVIAPAMVGLAHAECNKLGCWEVQEYRASSGSNGLYWNGAWQGWNLYTTATTGAEVGGDEWVWTGFTIPQYQMVGASTTCTNPSVYPGEATGGTVWGPNTNVSQAFCANTANNPSARPPTK